MRRRTPVGRPGVRRRFAFAVLAASMVAAACGGRGLSREGLRDGYVDKLVDGGVGRQAAECVVDRLFDEMTDDELRRFNTEGTSLTASESARIAQLADACGA